MYRIVIGGQQADAFSVNVDPAEMDAARITPDELERLWAGHRVIWIRPGDDLVKTVTEARFGTEIRPLFLWAVAALFFLEMWVARTRRRDLTAASGSPDSMPAEAPSRA